MTKAWLPVACFALSLSAAADTDTDEPVVRDLFFGEAMFYADQGRYFDALERLDIELAQHYGVDEPALDALHYYINDAEFSVGDFELSYRMHHRAGRAISAVLEGDVDEIVRNEAAYRLARIHFQKGQLAEAITALDRIEGEVPEGLDTEIDFLRANALMASGSPGAAAEIFDGLQEADGLVGFAGYNMGIALLEDGQRQQALQQLDRAGQVGVADEATRSIRDKANLVLGSLLMEDEAFNDAQLR
ncbi:MAG: tetratricopeptide repeat protein, partial [Gammaproteobacteria bacterium]